MHSSVLVFLQGGLANQLIQLSYAHHLARNTYDIPIFYTSLFLHPLWYLISADTPRTLSPLIKYQSSSQHVGISHGLARLILDFLATYPATSSTFNTFISSRPLLVRGWHHEPASFDSSTTQFWEYIKYSLLTIKPPNCVKSSQSAVAIHARLGDYLQPKYRQTYVSISPVTQLRVGISTSYARGGNGHVNVFSDDPSHYLSLIPSDLHSYITLSYEASPEATLASIIRHDSIVCSNSSFSLIAAFLMNLDQNSFHSRKIFFPSAWYHDPYLNQQQYQLISSLEIKSAQFYSIL